MRESAKEHCYLFDANYTIVKETDNESHWYKRDRVNHVWIKDDMWEFVNVNEYLTHMLINT